MMTYNLWEGDVQNIWNLLYTKPIWCFIVLSRTTELSNKKLEIARCSNNLYTQLERKILIYCSFVKLSQINWNKTQLGKEIVLWCFNKVHCSCFISQLGQMWLDVKDASFKYIYWRVRFVHGFEERIHSCKLCVFVTWIIFEMLIFCVLDYL